MTRLFTLFRLALPFTLMSGLPLLAQTEVGRVYDRVEVRGAEFIPEEDIRLTCGALEGIALDGLQLRSVEECLMMTGVFEEVRVSGQGDVLIIDVTEVESRPGRIDAGVAWVNDYGLAGTLAYEQFNLIPDTFLGIRSSYAQDHRSYALNLYRKEAFGPDLHFGLELEGERTRHDDRSFATRSDLAEIYLGWTPLEDTRLEFGLGYRDHRMFDLDPGASALLQAERGRVGAPFLHLALVWGQGSDEDPRSHSLRLDQYFWNLGTGSQVAETRLEANSRFALGERSTLLLGVRAGIVAGRKGHDTTVLDRAFLGGETFRGFAPRGLGPADAGDRLGGNRYVVGSVEYQRVLGSVSDNAIRGGIFMDVGSLWSLDNTLGGVIDDKARLRGSIGVSMTFGVGELPVSLYLATPLKRQNGDRRQVFGLTAAARF
ncbi:BamA/TamA family outer membrane protein [Szabonella alba]|uniref:BamA/TamA family outer membrane protein n=1 Tax=Szabonella alba TaxID=2804194 RepID=A0A8K0Y2V1_9RHOB|nr:BamA/TamA family outer membrane protein [Szabonella alba]MBL4919414.1 BamA/TamA family outer membrane protein [Szabonella alba]